jgi:hypothetical protein
MRTYTSNDLMGAQIVFCVDFEYAGKLHRYSTNHVVIPSSDGVLEYLPTIRDFDYVDSADVLAVDVEANIVSMGIVFQDIDVLKVMSEGQILEGVTAEFFYVLIKNGQCINTYEKRVVLYTGQIQEPVYGDPSDIDNFVAFSIESQPYTSENLLLDESLIIDNRFANPDADTATGKPYPVVFGSPASSPNIYTLPAYCIKKYDSHSAHMMIAGHRVESTTATIQDDSFNTATKSILIDDDGKGNVYSYIELVPADNVAIPGTSTSGDSREWWIRLNAGGYINTYGDGDLTRGGDICRWALHRSGQRIDDGEWANLSVLLNQYSFAGYINDAEVTAFEWLNGSILPYLPVTMQMGANGIRPVITELWALTHVASVYSIEVGDDKQCQQSSPVQTLRNTADLANDISLKYAKRGHDQAMSKTKTVQSNLAKQSQNRYGRRPRVIEADYIYDNGTASKVVMDKIRALSTPLQTVDIDAPSELGWLQVGNVIDVSIPRVHLSSRKMMVITKYWSDGYWVFTLLFE